MARSSTRSTIAPLFRYVTVAIAGALLALAVFYLLQKLGY
jgi:putative flippase GtrA